MVLSVAMIDMQDRYKDKVLAALRNNSKFDQTGGGNITVRVYNAEKCVISFIIEVQRGQIIY